MSHSDAYRDLFTTPAKDKWKRIGTRRRSGVAVPLFSVHSSQSLGVGELDDIRLLVDWCVKTGNSIIQLLPMNEVGPFFCPYDSISSFALEPMYLSLRLIPGSQEKSFREKLDEVKEEFPAGKAYVDYRIKEVKTRLLRELFFSAGEEDVGEFKEFIGANGYWIHDFALYKVLKEYHNGKAWDEWEDEFRDRDGAALEVFARRHEEEIAFHLWVQWHLSMQFARAHEYAASKKVLVKGDLPVLVSRDSADVWVHRGFFKLDFAAGAPPDMYCAKGQRWGMPTYNWEAISEDGYTYVKEKLKYAENFYDMLRIDHVVGLFRIWSIPYDEPLENLGLNGFFDPPDGSVWGACGRDVLSKMLDSTTMLLLAEDLGVIPPVCPETLKEFGIPGNDVERWVKDWDVTHDFLEPHQYRPISVAMLSTHDTTNWAAWWENEAGTVDEDLFVRKCAERGVSYEKVKKRLFSSALSKHGRLRWLNTVTSIVRLAKILGKETHDIGDFINLYENTFHEKEKLWAHLKMGGRMRERSDPRLVGAALRVTLESRAIFCIQLILDWLCLTDTLKGDPYRYRINRPGTISRDNWALTIPISLDGLLEHKVSGDIRKMVVSSGRA